MRDLEYVCMCSSRPLVMLLNGKYRMGIVPWSLALVVPRSSEREN